MATSVHTEVETSTKTLISSRQFASNVLSNVSVLVLNVLVGVWFTPYLIAHLGVALYGIVVLANAVTNYMSIANAAIGSVTSRYLTIEIQQRKTHAANLTFNTAFWACLLLITGVLPIILLFTNAIPNLFHIPEDAQTAAKALFLATLTSYLLFVLKGVFDASAFAYNRLDLQNATNALNIGMRILIVIILFSLATQPALWHVGAGIVIGGILSLILSIVIWRKLTPELKIS